MNLATQVGDYLGQYIVNESQQGVRWAYKVENQEWPKVLVKEGKIIKRVIDGYYLMKFSLIRFSFFVTWHLSHMVTNYDTE